MDALDKAAERLRAHLRAQQREEVHAAIDCEVTPHHLAREAVASVLPLLPGMIEARVGDADARIYSRNDLRRMLAEFAVDLLLAQTSTVMRWLRAKVREQRTPRTTSKGG